MRLARGDAQARIEDRLDGLEEHLEAIWEGLRFTVAGVPSPQQKPELQVIFRHNPIAA
jgi:hypothetical protein